MNEQLSTDDNSQSAVGDNPTVEEVMDSLTGWEELAIEEASERSIADMATSHQTLLTRAAAAVIVWRDLKAENPRAKFGPVFKDMMGRRGSEISAYFRRPTGDADDGFGGTDGEAGKDIADSGPETLPSPPSASPLESPQASTPI